MLTEKEAQSLYEQKKTYLYQQTTLKELLKSILLSLSATNSLVGNADLTRPNVYSTKHKTYQLCCGDTTKTVFSEDLNLCEKYLFG